MKHRLHKWFAVSAGVFIMAQCLSGIAMILPVPQSGPLEKKSQPSVNYSEVSLSPAEAVTKLSKVLESSTQVSSVTMLQIRDLVAYRMTLQSGESYLMNASSGEILTIDLQIAEQIARHEFSTEVPVREVVHLFQHDSVYPRGPIPAFRVIFGDRTATISHVSIQDGNVRRANRWSRLKDRMIQLHTFRNLIAGHEKLRKSLLLVLSLLALATAGTGYYLALSHWLTHRRLRRQ